jgi:hypothetical protein
VSAQWIWCALDEAGEARAAANRSVFPQQILTFQPKRPFDFAIYLICDKTQPNRAWKRRFRLQSMD